MNGESKTTKFGLTNRSIRYDCCIFPRTSSLMCFEAQCRLDKSNLTTTTEIYIKDGQQYHQCDVYSGAWYVCWFCKHLRITKNYGDGIPKTVLGCVKGVSDAGKIDLRCTEFECYWCKWSTTLRVSKVV